MSQPTTNSPPRRPEFKYTAPLGTRWEREKAAAGAGAFDLPDDPKRIGPWIIGECVGKGASGRVKIAKHRTTGQLAAVKILPLQPVLNSRASQATCQAKTDKQRLGVDREITMMKLMDHPNIMRIYDAYEGETELYLVLEYVGGGELFDFLVNRGKLPPLEALTYFKQIIHGLNYAHTFSIVHRDLKPENILIHTLDPPLVKIADWGMAAFAPPLLQLETMCGSPHYVSPEIVNGERYEGGATDIWSCGVILFALLTGGLPFDDDNIGKLLGKVKIGKYKIPDYVNPLAKDLVRRMLVVDVAKRITIPQILAHPFFLVPTPRIPTPPPPPSISLLARPLPSRAHIERDLLESLRIIWGRHADAEGEEIVIDLLSPAGKGTLAKAFYFLLSSYRQRTTGIVDDTDKEAPENGKIVTKQYTALASARPRANLGVESTAHIQFRFGRPAAPPPSRSPSPSLLPIPLNLNIPLPKLERTSSVKSQSRAPTPLGPREPNSAVQSGSDHRTLTVSSPVSSPPQYEEVNSGRPDLPAASQQLWQVPSTATPSPPGVSTVPFPAKARDVSQADALVPPIGSPAMRAMFDSRQDQRLSRTGGAGSRRNTLSPPNWHNTFYPQIKVPTPTRRSTLNSPIQSPLPAASPMPMFSAIEPPCSPVPLRMFTSPKTDNVEVQRAIDDITERVNQLNARGNARAHLIFQNGGWYAPGDRNVVPERVTGFSHANGYPGYTNVDGYPLPDPAVYIPPEPENTLSLNVAQKVLANTSQTASHANKENTDVDSDVEVDIVMVPSHKHLQVSEGLGLGWAGKDMGNIMHTNNRNREGHRGKGKQKEKRHRATTLDQAHALDRKWSVHTPSVHHSTSPNAVGASPAMSTILQSPALGEVKGWFSNLFNWKSLSYVLCSMSDMWTTKNEARRLLESMGVEVTEGEEAGVAPLKCLVTEGIEGHRSVKFRVEFSIGNGFASSPQPATSRRFSQFSPNPSTGKSPTQVGVYTCAIMLVQEKGSMSTFRAVHRRLRDLWWLDPE